MMDVEMKQPTPDDLKTVLRWIDWKLRLVAWANRPDVAAELEAWKTDVINDIAFYVPEDAETGFDALGHGAEEGTE